MPAASLPRLPNLTAVAAGTTQKRLRNCRTEKQRQMVENMENDKNVFHPSHRPATARDDSISEKYQPKGSAFPSNFSDADGHPAA
jgi:hypothetical protein